MVPIKTQTMKTPKKNNNTTKSISVGITSLMFRYVIGCLLFISASVGLIALGVLTFVKQWHYAYLGVLALAGIYFLVQIFVVILKSPPHPDYYIPINRDNCNFDNLFDELDKVSSIVGTPMPDKVYISIKAECAMFSSPIIGHLPLLSDTCLVIGIPYLIALSRDDLRVMLCHEFAHYRNADLKNEGKLYRIGSFSGYFIKSNIKYLQTRKANQIKLLSSVFTSYSIVMYEKIRKKFRSVELQMECAADDVARQCTSDQRLKQALLKASYVKYIFNYVNWGCWQLDIKGIYVQNKYKVMMELINLVPQPETRRFTNNHIMQRLKRLQGEVSIDFSVYDEFHKLDELDLSLDKMVCCSNADFLLWLTNTYHIYENYN